MYSEQLPVHPLSPPVGMMCLLPSAMCVLIYNCKGFVKHCASWTLGVCFVLNRSYRRIYGLRTQDRFCIGEKMAGRLWYTLAVVLVIIWAFSEVSEGQMSRPRRPPRKKKGENVEPTIPPESNIDINQMLGKWYLLNVASKCSYLMTPGNKLEATTITLDLTTSGTEQKLSVITTTRYNHQCWEIRQLYDMTPSSGFFILKGDNPNLDTRVTIMDTDYTSYAILAYEKQRKTAKRKSAVERKVTMKLYARSVETLHEPMLLNFENTAATKNIGLDYMFPPHITSHCETVDKDHVINCIPTC